MSTKAGRAVLGCVVAATLAMAACSDRITSVDRAPMAQTDAQGNLLGGLLGGVQSLLLAPLHRTTPLAQNVTWTFTVGPAGGTSSNSAVGLTIVVPPNAVSSTKTITVTALAGSPVAYGFSHMEFKKKIYLTQNLSGTSVGLLNSLFLKGGHFSGSTPTYVGGLALLDEVVSGLVLPWTQTVTIGVNHFSGWILVSGYSGGGESSSGEAQ